MTARHRVELRRCRPGLPDQEFAYSARETREDGRREVATITHVPTGADLAAAAGGRGPFNVTRVFGDGLFLGADEYVHLRVSGADDLKGFPQQYHLANGVSILRLCGVSLALRAAPTFPVSKLTRDRNCAVFRGEGVRRGQDLQHDGQDEEELRRAGV